MCGSFDALEILYSLLAQHGRPNSVVDMGVQMGALCTWRHLHTHAHGGTYSTKTKHSQPYPPHPHLLWGGSRDMQCGRQACGRRACARFRTRSAALMPSSGVACAPCACCICGVAISNGTCGWHVWMQYRVSCLLHECIESAALRPVTVTVVVTPVNDAHTWAHPIQQGSRDCEEQSAVLL